jgi:enamine deaminase RidA (YjgF/YER057c/UK114 family)
MWKTLQPEGWVAPKGYANGIEARGRLIFVAGMIGWNQHAQFESDDFVEQCAQALRNIVATLACANAAPAHLTRMTWYVKDKQVYLQRARELGRVYRSIIGSHFPVMTLVQVADLLEDRALVEIEATAVVPEAAAAVPEAAATAGGTPEAVAQVAATAGGIPEAVAQVAATVP